MTTANRLRGLRALLEDAVDQGASAVERVHRATASRPFDVLDHVAPIAPAARGVRLVHDVTVAGVYEAIRQINHLVGATLEMAIEVVERASEDDDPGAPARPEPASDEANPMLGEAAQPPTAS
jgi:hypothetical protein